jgi:hypothetical protein
MTSKLSEIVKCKIGKVLNLTDFFKNNPLCLDIESEEIISGNQLIYSFIGDKIVTITWSPASLDIIKSNYQNSKDGLVYLSSELIEENNKMYNTFKKRLFDGRLAP